MNDIENRSNKDSLWVEIKNRRPLAVSAIFLWLYYDVTPSFLESFLQAPLLAPQGILSSLVAPLLDSLTLQLQLSLKGSYIIFLLKLLCKGTALF